MQEHTQGPSSEADSPRSIIYSHDTLPKLNHSYWLQAVVELVWTHVSVGRPVVAAQMLPTRHPGAANLAAIREGIAQVRPSCLPFPRMTE